MKTPLFVALCAPAFLAAAAPAAPLPPRPVPLDHWANPGTVVNGGAVTVGVPSRIALIPAGARMPAFAGSLSVLVDKAGVYSIALSGPGWIDVRSGGTQLRSVAHRHGETGSGVRKIVDFKLPRGRSVIALSKAETAAMTLIIFPAR